MTDDMDGEEMGRTNGESRALLRLALLFATIYVVQGLIEPTTGLVAEPVESLLKRWGETPGEIGFFLALVGLPWCLKPLFGLLSDFRPLRGSRRRSYLLLSASIATIAFLALGITHLVRSEQIWLTLLMFLTTMAVAAADVVLDAHMLDVTRPLGVTARIQSVQYGGAYLGAMLAGVIGGMISETQRTGTAFILCGALMAFQWWIILCWVHEAPSQHRTLAEIGPMVRKSFGWTIRSRSFQAVAILLAIYHLNPFTQASVYLYLTGPLKLDDSVYGNNLAWASAGGLLATIVYGSFGGRLPLKLRANLGILGGVISNLAYLAVTGENGLYAIGLLVGFSYLLGGLALIDLAARSCPVDATGTVYATFMSLCGLCAALATWFGGALYSGLSSAWGTANGFYGLAICGAMVTASCWVVSPLIPWRELESDCDEKVMN